MRIPIVIVVSSIPLPFRNYFGVFVDFLRVKCYDYATVMTVFC